MSSNVTAHIPRANHMQKAGSLFENRPLALVAGDGFELSVAVRKSSYMARLRSSLVAS